MNTKRKIEFVIDEKECHICISHSCNGNGYPYLRRNNKSIKMSRILWEEKYGPIPKKMQVCHKCDTPACINTDHFFLGTIADNAHDRDRKGRNISNLKIGAKGEEIGHKLTEKQVLQIREEPGLHREIAAKYNVSRKQIGNIKNRKSWGWL